MANQIYHTWLERIQQLRPKERITRLRNFAWIAAGILMSRSVHLSHIAGKMVGLATTPSKTRRLSRFLDNGAVRVREWYEPVARDLLRRVVDHGLEVRLLADGTKIGFGHQLLMVAIAYRRRAIPLAWTWVRSPKGHSSAYKQRALLTYIRGLMPSEAQVLIVGDSEFGAVEVLRQLDRWKWHYVMRQKSNTRVKLQEGLTWLRFGALVKKGDRPRWTIAALLTQKHAYSTNLLAYWKAGEKEPWLLATNLTTARTTRRAYKRRMWIEEMFGDFKKHGFDLESSHLRHFFRLSRLTLVVAFLYYWLVAFGSQVIKRGQRRLVDRPDRKDLSIFRIGLDMVDRSLANAQPLVIRLVPYFS
ncbi:MAG: IS4 family transposase [Candidatus Eremiobacteraeota bacterium]|nr:IS4 family transposase [Candidatus Eremiobacteraeota bacterium]